MAISTQEGKYVVEGLDNQDTYSRAQTLVPQGMPGVDPTHKYIQHHRTHTSGTGSLTFNSSEIIKFLEPLVPNYTQSLVNLSASFYKSVWFLKINLQKQEHLEECLIMYLFYHRHTARRIKHTTYESKGSSLYI